MNLKYIVIILAFCISLFSCQSGDHVGSEFVKEVDVCVYGGTSAGVVAAYSAKKMGKSVLLIEPGKYLGGMTTGGLGMTDIGNKYAVTGLARLFYRRIGEHYNKFEQWTFPPSLATATMNRFIEDAELDVLYYRRITDAQVQNKRIKNITLEDSKQPFSSFFPLPYVFLLYCRKGAIHILQVYRKERFLLQLPENLSEQPFAVADTPLRKLLIRHQPSLLH